MDEAVPERPLHGEVHATLRGGIPCCDHHPAIGKLILAELAIEHELVAASLRHLRRRGQLIQKEYAFSARGQDLGGSHSACSAEIRGRPRKSTGSSCTARTSRNCQFISEATCATIWDLPTPQAPQICKGTRWPISACSASKSAEISFRNGWSGEVEMKWKRRCELPWSRRTARLRIPDLSLHRSGTDERVSILAASETQLSGNSRHT
jgi:hypothetical protein